jgi:hypothetical protein
VRATRLEGVGHKFMWSGDQCILRQERSFFIAPSFEARPYGFINDSNVQASPFPSNSVHKLTKKQKLTIQAMSIYIYM